MKEVSVSVICPAYNHEAYIAKALDGFLMQKTNFPFEVIIHDDASKDRTPGIIRDYESNHPDFFTSIIQLENQYSKRPSSIIHEIIFPRTKGKYIAICEGDDYWTDPGKLQKQFALMEAHPDLSMSFHAAYFEYPNSPQRRSIHRYGGREAFTAEEVILGGGGFYPTCSAMFRRDVFEDYPPFFLEAPIGDLMWALNAVVRGRVGYIDEIMAVYNAGNPESWTAVTKRKSFSETIELVATIETIQCSYDRFTQGRFSSVLRRRNSRNYLGALAVAGSQRQGLRAFLKYRGKLTNKHRLCVLPIVAFAALESRFLGLPSLARFRRLLVAMRRIGTKLFSHG